MYDFHNNSKVLASKVGTLSNNTAVVATADTQGFLGLEFFVQSGTFADADMTFAILVEDSSDNSNWSAVADNFLLGLEIPASGSLDYTFDNKTMKIGYAGANRYVRLTLTPSANTDASPYAILGIGVKPRVAPYTTQIV